MDDLISRAAAIDEVRKNTFRLTFAEEQNCEGHVAWSADAVYSDAMEGALLELPSAQPEYKPVRVEDIAKTMAENTLFSFSAWHGEALELIQRYGFVICKKTM